MGSPSECSLHEVVQFDIIDDDSFVFDVPFNIILVISR